VWQSVSVFIVISRWYWVSVIWWCFNLLII